MTPLHACAAIITGLVLIAIAQLTRGAFWRLRARLQAEDAFAPFKTIREIRNAGRRLLALDRVSRGLMIGGLGLLALGTALLFIVATSGAVA